MGYINLPGGIFESLDEKEDRMINVDERRNFKIKDLAEIRVIVLKDRLDHRYFIQGAGESAK